MEQSKGEASSRNNGRRGLLLFIQKPESSWLLRGKGVKTWQNRSTLTDSILGIHLDDAGLSYQARYDYSARA